MNIAFHLLRIITGLTSLAAVFILAAIILLRSSLTFAKESLAVLGYVARLFTSAFTEGTAPGDPSGWVVSFPQMGLALLFIAMLVSVFLPENKIFLHLVAACSALAGLWYLRMFFVGASLEILCLPALLLWFLYYAACLFRSH